MYLKIHKTGPQEVVALCDEELIGKTLEENKFQLKISERFYKGEELSEDKIINILKSMGNLNIVGDKSVELALKIGIISEEDIIKIKGVPHVQVISF
ncbi:hypothetical protein CL621_04125 [archaeon]|nr:hypothetical protein [archaeon]|tara:strand:- start:831 stop:1121 length:291 start_codon:yes stop_codon:yes gene_type:complete